MSAFAVFGNPIKHSKSSEIYALFAKEVGILGKYDLRLVLEKENFNNELYDFFKSEGLGANITVPFKERAFLLCNQLTDRAKITRSVNTIKKKINGDLLGDNTDGIGFINDLKRLKWVNENNIFIQNRQRYFSCSSNKVNILLLGAGGAAKGIIPELLNISNCNIKIVNRTYSSAQVLMQLFHNMGYDNISCIPLDELFLYSNEQYALIINATTSSMYNCVPKIPSFIITPITKCYDLFYQKTDTAFLVWCKKNGSKYCVDGLGMLVEQAAHSFYLWHNIFPTNIAFVLSFLKSML